MSLSNPSQLLLRNKDLLASAKPLVVGCPDSEFFTHFQAAAPEASLSSYNINFAEYQSITAKHGNTINALFNEQYSSTSLHDLVIIYFPKSKTPNLAKDIFPKRFLFLIFSILFLSKKENIF